MRELARRSGVSHATISTVISGETRPSFEFCQAVAKPLEIRPEEVFRLAGLLRPLRGDEKEATYRELVDIAREMTVEERRMMIDFGLWLVERTRAEKRIPTVGMAGSTAEAGG
jgi:transcriptional regulator with XRE-family HTH domain